MAESDDKLDKKTETTLTYKTIIGICIVYGLLIMTMIPIMFEYAPFWMFIVYICNIDQIALALSVSFPEYFNYIYSEENNILWSDISFHIIRLISLVGIFLYGLQMKLVGRTDRVVLEGMIVISIITYTLPEYLLPRLTEMLDTYTHSLEKYKTRKGYLSIVVSFFIVFLFISVESFILKNYVHTRHIESKNKRLFK